MKSASTLLIRADASVTTGTGHVMRCLALAQAWQDMGGQVVFVMAESTPAVSERLRSENVEVTRIAAATASQDDAQQVVELARNSYADWVVVDGYQFGTDYQRDLKSAGCKLLVLDDAGAADSPADLILNQNSNAHENMYPRHGGRTRLLLGTKYVLLRREFKAAGIRKHEVPRVAKRVLITMGGSDPDNVTARSIQALSLLKTNGLKTTVIAGGSNLNFELLRQAARDLGDRIDLKEAASNMAELMAQADLAIIAGGGTLWELLYMSCPVLSFARNEVQAGILADLQAGGILQFLGDPRSVASASLAAAIDELASSSERREKMAMLGRLEVDGEGARRVCEIMAG
jgi:UDP-2,4-diacetamido-2,4,6-trideoxy-beta-L-altropyranose hydrolase